MNVVVIALNYTTLGRPRSCPSFLLPGRRLNAVQWGIVRRLEAFLEDWLIAKEVGPESMGRAAPKIENIEEALKFLTVRFQSISCDLKSDYFGARNTPSRSEGLSADVGEVVGKSSSPLFSTFKELDPDRLRFVGTPSFDPVPYLDPAGARIYQYPLQCRVPAAEFTGTVPHVRMHCSFEAKIRLFELLDQCERLKIVRRDEIEPRFASGMFSVVKSINQDRLILDSRPANALEIPLEGWIKSLGSAEMLTKIYLPPGFILRSSGSDLRDFYHLFLVGEERARRNVLCGGVPPSFLKHLDCFPPELENEPTVFGCLATLAMGDTQAVTLAQTAHLSLALRCGAAHPGNLVCLSCPVPRGPDFVGIVIDDYVSISKVRDVSVKPSHGALLAKKIERRYGEVGLVSHPEKGFEDEEAASFWGIDLNGRRGLIRGTLKRAIPLFGILLQIVRLGYSTVDLLQIVSGSLISLFLFRRRIFCILDLIFQSCVGREKDDIIKLSGALKSELLVSCFLIPFACTDLRASPRGRLCATDASNWGEAGVLADVEASVSQELVRHCLKKSVWTKLLPPGKAWERTHDLLDPESELPSGIASYSMNPLWEVLARSLKYRLLFKRRAPNPRHINIGELRAFLRAEVILGLEQPGSRDIFALDSQVCLGCISKGRSSSPSLNKELEKTLGNVLGLGLFPETVYFETKLNPADDPTRGVPLREPTRSLPSWWHDVAVGKFEPFDAWLQQEGLDAHSVSGLPPFDELLAGHAQGLAGEGIHKDPENASTFSTAQVDFESTGLNFEPCRGVAFSALTGAYAGISVGSDCTFEGAFGTLSGEDASFVFDFLVRSFHQGQVICGAEFSWPPRKAGFLDLFSGEKGVAYWLQKFSDSWVITFEIDEGAEQDLDQEPCRRNLEKLLALGVFEAWGGGPVCSSFSRAICPAVRTRLHPEGLADMRLSMRPKVEQGNNSAAWIAKLCELSLMLGIFFWVENPDGSFLFLQAAWTELIEKWGSAVGFWRLDYCRYGTAWRKRTRIFTNSILKDVCTFCLRDHIHTPLRGRSKINRKSWTLVAQPYPRNVAKTIAGGIATSCGYLAESKGGFDPASFAFCPWRRIGEAKNPGPRADRSFNLEEVKLVETKTLQLQGKIWAWFLRWVCNSVSKEASESLMRNPMTLCLLAKEFGLFLFKEGKPLYILRHLIALISKQIFGAKPFLVPCWELISKWEELEPTEHRTPLPLAILRAMVVVSLHWHWDLFAATLLISFFGITRPGEVLRAYRADLSLPSDRLMTGGAPCFLKIRAPKSRRRGGARVQHASILDSLVVGFLETSFRGGQRDKLLYPISPSSFRRRWDSVLKFLEVDGAKKLTPGSLRAGGAIEEYRNGTDLTKLLWRMRLRHLLTLEHYVQELAADSFLAELTPRSRRKIFLFGELFAPTLTVVAASGSFQD